MTKLTTVKTLHETYFKGAIQPNELEQLIRDSRCYRQVGKTIMLTDDDVRAFIASLSARRHGHELEPRDDEVGQIVVIGNRQDYVYIGWTEFGGELDLLERLQMGHVGKLVVYDTIEPATYGECKELRSIARDNGHWWQGYWHCHDVIDTVDEWTRTRGSEKDDGSNTR